jgi:hypothetical protein
MLLQYGTFSQKIVSKLSAIWVEDPRSGIWKTYPGSGSVLGMRIRIQEEGS